MVLESRIEPKQDNLNAFILGIVATAYNITTQHRLACFDVNVDILRVWI